MDKNILLLGGLAALVWYLYSQSETAAAISEEVPSVSIPPTLPSPKEKKRRVLKLGMRGDDVKALQRALIAARYPVTVDGIFGKAVQGAVLRYQAAKGLKADGIVGPATQASLRL